jgi:hypothetical protein
MTINLKRDVNSPTSVYNSLLTMSARKKFQLQIALGDRDPYYSGICPIPDYQRLLYYTHGDLLR